MFIFNPFLILFILLVSKSHVECPPPQTGTPTTTKESPINMIIFGAPGSGKGTICSLLKEILGIVHLSTGDLLRERSASNDALAIQIQNTISSGQFVSDSLIFEVLRSKLTNDSQCAVNGFILDGFPRTMNQLEMLNDLMNQLNITIHLTILLEIPDELICERIVGRLVHRPSGRIYHRTHKAPKQPMKDDVTGEPLEIRSDDTEKALKERLQDYYQKTFPITNWYDQRHNLLRVDSSKESSYVVNQITDHINQLNEK